QREEAQAEQHAAREAIVEHAEQVASQDPAKTQWKQSTAKMRELFDQWRATQKAGPRLSRATEDALRGRFRTARNTFAKNRRAFFSQLYARNAEAKTINAEIISRAASIHNSYARAPTIFTYQNRNA